MDDLVRSVFELLWADMQRQVSFLLSEHPDTAPTIEDEVASYCARLTELSGSYGSTTMTVSNSASYRPSEISPVRRIPHFRASRGPPTSTHFHCKNSHAHLAPRERTSCEATPEQCVHQRARIASDASISSFAEDQGLMVQRNVGTERTEGGRGNVASIEICELDFGTGRRLQISKRPEVASGQQPAADISHALQHPDSETRIRETGLMQHELNTEEIGMRAEHSFQPRAHQSMIDVLGIDKGVPSGQYLHQTFGRRNSGPRDSDYVADTVARSAERDDVEELDMDFASGAANIGNNPTYQVSARDIDMPVSAVESHHFGNPHEQHDLDVQQEAEPEPEPEAHMCITGGATVTTDPITPDSCTPAVTKSRKRSGDYGRCSTAKRKGRASENNDLATTATFRGLPTGLVTPRKLLQEFAQALPDEKIETHWFLTMLFFNIASPISLSRLRDSCSEMRKKKDPAAPTDETSIQDTMQALDRLDSHELIASILRRLYLARLVELRDRRQEHHLRDIPKLIEKSLKYGHVKRRALKVNEGKKTVATKALRDLMAEAYPYCAGPNVTTDSVSQPDDGHTSDYQKKYALLKTRLTSGRNWHLIERQFSSGILATMCFGDQNGIRDSDIERLSKHVFNTFLTVLERHRGRFLRDVSASLTLCVFDILLGKPTSGRLAFEYLEPSSLELAPFDSLQLQEACYLI